MEAKTLKQESLLRAAQSKSQGLNLGAVARVIRVPSRLLPFSESGLDLGTCSAEGNYHARQTGG